MPRASRMWRAVVGLGLSLACALRASGDDAAPPANAPASSGGIETVYHKGKSFRIPFSIDESVRSRTREIQLFASTDQGQTWQAVDRTTPDQTAFHPYRAAQDGEYWFAIRTLDTKGRLYPADDSEVKPSLKVFVDTTPPVLELKPMGRRGEWASVRWEVRDKYLDPNSLVIQYKAEGARDWRSVPIHDRTLIGTEEWQSGTASSLVVRAWVDDRAGNRTQTEIILPDGIAAQPPTSAELDEQASEPPPISPITSASLTSGAARPSRKTEPDGFDPPPLSATPRSAPTVDSFGDRPDESGFESPPRPATVRQASSSREGANAPRRLQVSNPRFDLQYAVEDAGPEGPAVVELWVTRDGGKSWMRQPPDEDRTSPYPVDLGSEGTFGLWLSVQSAASLGDPPPQPGDRPQLWVEVDSTPPAVRLDMPRIGTGRNLGKVLITWKASDPHMGTRPVLLSYRADRPDSPWTPITSRLDNTGQYIWTMPLNAPPRFHLRIDVVDSMGNRASDETTPNGPILVDRSRPKGRILGLDTHGGDSPNDRTRQ